MSGHDRQRRLSCSRRWQILRLAPTPRDLLALLVTQHADLPLVLSILAVEIRDQRFTILRSKIFIDTSRFTMVRSSQPSASALHRIIVLDTSERVLRHLKPPSADADRDPCHLSSLVLSSHHNLQRTHSLSRAISKPHVTSRNVGSGRPGRSPGISRARRAAGSRRPDRAASWPSRLWA